MRKRKPPHTWRGNLDIAQGLHSRYFGSDQPNYLRLIARIQEWDITMSRKTYRIELKIDFNDDARHDALIQIATQYARDLLASAGLLSDGRKPVVALITDDTFTGVEELEVMPASEELHTA